MATATVKQQREGQPARYLRVHMVEHYEWVTDAAKATKMAVRTAERAAEQYGAVFGRDSVKVERQP